MSRTVVMLLMLNESQSRAVRGIFSFVLREFFGHPPFWISASSNESLPPELCTGVSGKHKHAFALVCVTLPLPFDLSQPVPSGKLKLKTHI